MGVQEFGWCQLGAVKLSEEVIPAYSLLWRVRSSPAHLAVAPFPGRVSATLLPAYESSHRGCNGSLRTALGLVFIIKSSTRHFRFDLCGAG